jgi:antitoxin PrlF
MGHAPRVTIRRSTPDDLSRVCIDEANKLWLDQEKEIPYYRLMITSRLTSKAQTTIPQAVRVALHLREGDELAYVIEDGRVILTRRAVEAKDDPFAAFGEWSGEEDTRAYAAL